MNARPSSSLLLTAAAAAALVVGSTAAAWLGIVAPTRSAAAAVATEADRLAAAVASVDALAIEIAGARTEEAALAERAAAGVTAGRYGERNARLAGLLDIAGSEGLEVLRMDPTEPVRVGGYAEVVIELEARGGYAAHRRFLGRLDAGPRDLRVSSLTLRPEGGADAAPDLLTRYLLTWSVHPVGAAAAGDPGGTP